MHKYIGTIEKCFIIFFYLTTRVHNRNIRLRQTQKTETFVIKSFSLNRCQFFREQIGIN